VTGTDPLRIGLVITVLDEASSIDSLLESIVAQTLPPDEVVVVDGGSVDGTVARLRCWEGRLPLTVVTLPGASISTGRNRALAAVRADIVAVTDAGVRLDPAWLAELTEPFRRRANPPDVAAGFFRADPRTVFELALAATTLPNEQDIREERFLPSSRSVAFRRSLFEAGLRYPEWLDYGEDLVFDLRLRRSGARFEFRPLAYVWFRPRQTPGAHWSQYYRYARGDGKAGLFGRRHLLRYLTYGVLVPAVLLRRDRPIIVAAGVGALLYLRQPWARLWRRHHEFDSRQLVPAAALVPGLRLLGDVAKMAGYPFGLVWRARRYGLRRNWRTVPEDAGLLRRDEVGQKP